MDGDTPHTTTQAPACDLKLEQEKLRLERERILLEQERLKAMRANIQIEAKLDSEHNRGRTFTLPTVALVSIICLLVGGIAGAFTANLRREQQKTQHLQEIMRALAETGGASTNTITQTPGGTWLRVSTPKAAHDGVATVVVQ